MQGFNFTISVSSRFNWPNKKKPIIFMDCLDGKEESTSEGNSMFNHVEASQVCVFCFYSFTVRFLVIIIYSMPKIIAIKLRDYHDITVAVSLYDSLDLPHKHWKK